MIARLALRILLVALVKLPISIQAAPPGDSLRAKKDRRLIALPALLRSPETKWGAGAAMSITFNAGRANSSSRTSNVQALGLYTQRSQKLIGVESTLFFNDENYILRFHGTYSFFPDKFWGLGNKTNFRNPELFTYEQFFIFPQLLKRIYKKLYAGISLEYQNVLRFHHQPQGLFINQNINGRHGGIVSGVGGLLTWDSRDNAFSPSHGQFAEISTTVFSDGTKSDFTYTNYAFDLRNYFQVQPGHVLAFQAYGNFNRGIVPFLSLASMGGSTIMRGYYSGRFRDNNLVAAQAEYRMHIWKRWGIVGFAGIGQVGNRLENFAFDRFKYAVGTGLRFALKPEERLNLRIDYGVAQHSRGVYLTIAEAF
jgi:outer membrane protein assembly factor BamA